MQKLFCQSVHFVLHAILLASLIIEIETMFASGAKGRSRSFGDMFHRRQSSISNMKPLTEGASSSSSLSSVDNVNPLIEKFPKASTSFADDQISLKEIKLHKTDEVPEVRNVLDLNLRETNPSMNNEYINPARDGVFARLGKTAFRYGVAAASGSALTIMGIEIQEYLKKNSTRSLIKTTAGSTGNDTGMTTESSTSEESDESAEMSSETTITEENEVTTEMPVQTTTAEDCDGIINHI